MTVKYPGWQFHRHEQRALPDLLPDLRIPCVAAALVAPELNGESGQLGLIEPPFDSGSPQGLRDQPRGMRVLLAAP